MYEERGIVHIETERFSRIKHDTQNPIITFCELFPERVGRFPIIALEDGHYVAPLVRRILQDPHLAKERSVLTTLVESARAGPGADMPGAAGVTHPVRTETAEVIQEFFRHLVESGPQLYFCGHHIAHAANAFFSSGCESALTITLDGGGPDYPLESAAPPRPVIVYGGVYRCRGTDCQAIAQLTETSFGWAWVRATALLELNWGEEGTTMAMAALGDPSRF